MPGVLSREEEEEELHQSSQRRLIRRNTNTRIEYPSTNLETVINVAYDQKKVGLPNKSTQRRHEWKREGTIASFAPLSSSGPLRTMAEWPCSEMKRFHRISPMWLEPMSHTHAM